MDKIIEANQYRPYELMKNSFLHKRQAIELLQIAKQNQPHLSVEEIVEMFQRLSKHGCSGAALANIIGKQFYTNDKDFTQLFGFSLYINGTNTLDYNKILVDIYSRFYNVFKAKFTQYDTYEFQSIEQAQTTFQLLGEKFITQEEALLALFSKNIYPNGYSKNGNLLFIDKNPKISTYIGSCNTIAEEKFGLPSIHSIETLQNICMQNHIEFTYKDLEISEKLTGLTNDHFDFWVDYYFASHQIPFTLQKKKIEKEEYGNTYEDFQSHINKIINSGSITVSVGPNSPAYMRTKMPYSWKEMSSEKRGHYMNFKEFNNKGDILVSTYGKTYIIPKEFYQTLIFESIQKVSKERIKEEKPKSM